MKGKFNMDANFLARDKRHF